MLNVINQVSDMKFVRKQHVQPAEIPESVDG